MTKEDSIYQRICSEFKYVDLLVKTSRDVAQNHLYFDLHDARPITLFDFDIIYGSLLSMTSGSQSLAARYGQKFDLFSTVPAIGSIQLRNLLSQVDHYTLPPGAESELYRWMRVILGKLDFQFDTFIRAIEEAKHSDDPVTHLLASRPQQSDIVQLLQKEIADLHTLTSDHKLLDLMRKKWIPCEELLGSEKEFESIVAYKIVLSTLNVQRRESRTYNNFNDALNVQYAVKLFNSRGTYEGKRVIPTLISGTEPIATLDLSQWLRGPGYEVRPRIFASLLYFRLAQSLRTKSDGSNLQISDLAEQLFKSTLKLADQYKDLLTTIKRRCPALDNDSIQKDPVVSDYIGGLEHTKSRFRADYTQDLQMSSRIASNDRVAVVNELLTAKLHSQLTSGRPVRVKEALDEISRMIAVEDESGEIRFWSGTTESYLLKDDLPATALERAAFDISVLLTVPNSLVETRQGTPIDGVTQHDWLVQPKLTLAVHPKMVDSFAVLRLEAEKRGPDEKILTIRWSHKTDCYTIWTACQALMISLIGNGNDLVTAEIRDASDGSYERKIAISDALLFLDEAFKGLANLAEGFFSYGNTRIHAHFQPVNDYELQVSVTTSGYFETQILPQFAEKISDEISEGIPAYNLRNLIETLQKKLLDLRF